MRHIAFALSLICLPAAAAAQSMTPQKVMTLPSTPPTLKEAYGSGARQTGTGHFDAIAPGAPAWAKVEGFIVENALK